MLPSLSRIAIAAAFLALVSGEIGQHSVAVLSLVDEWMVSPAPGSDASSSVDGPVATCAADCSDCVFVRSKVAESEGHRLDPLGMCAGSFCVELTDLRRRTERGRRTPAGALPSPLDSVRLQV